MQNDNKTKEEKESYGTIKNTIETIEMYTLLKNNKNKISKLETIQSLLPNLQKITEKYIKMGTDIHLYMDAHVELMLYYELTLELIRDTIIHKEKDKNNEKKSLWLLNKLEPLLDSFITIIQNYEYNRIYKSGMTPLDLSNLITLEQDIFIVKTPDIVTDQVPPIGLTFPIQNLSSFIDKN